MGNLVGLALRRHALPLSSGSSSCNVCVAFECPSLCIDVVSSKFEGKSAVNRQRMVYKAIWEDLQTTIHVVDHIVFPCFFSK
ncbi:hypothetical protein UlMin_005067 [Ulmus minor]